MALIEGEMPMNKVGALVNEDPHRIWTIFNDWVGKAYATDQLRILQNLGIDETSHKKVHQYVTVAVDMDERRVVHVTEGKDEKTVCAIRSFS